MSVPNIFYPGEVIAPDQMNENFATVVAGIDAFTGPTGSADIGFTQAGTGAVTRTAQAKMRDVVSVEDFGAVGDGVTDDTAAFAAALSAARYVYGTRGRVYAVGDINIPGSTTLDMRWAKLVPTPSASYVVKLTGFRPVFLNSAIDDGANSYLTKQTTLAAPALTGVTSVTVADASTYQVGMVILVELDNYEWHTTRINSIVGTEVGIQRPMPSDASIGLRTRASHGAVWLADCEWFECHNHFLQGCGFGIIAKTSNFPTLSSGADKGTVRTVKMYGAQCVGWANLANCNDIEIDDVLIYGSRALTSTYYGDGVTYSFAFSEPVTRINDVAVIVDGVRKVYAVDYTFANQTTVQFFMPPTAGSEVQIRHNYPGWVGIYNDAIYKTSASGGVAFTSARALEFNVGHIARDIDLHSFLHSFTDGARIDGLRLEGSVGLTRWDACGYLYTAKNSILSTASVSNSPMLGLRTTRAPASSLYSGVLGNCVNVGEDRELVIDPTSWYSESYTNAGLGDIVSVVATAMSMVTRGGPGFTLTSTGMGVGTKDPVTLLEVKSDNLLSVGLRAGSTSDNTGTANHPSFDLVNYNTTVVNTGVRIRFLGYDSSNNTRAIGSFGGKLTGRGTDSITGELYWRLGTTDVMRLASDALYSAVPLKVPAMALADLNSMVPVPAAGMQAVVTDATSTTPGATVVGGGANQVLVTYVRSSWKVTV